MTNSIYLRQASDGTDLGYNKAVTDAAVAVARSGDRRTYPATFPTSFSYPNASGVSTLRATCPRTYLSYDTFPNRAAMTVRQVTDDATMQSALTAAGASSTPSIIVVALGTYTGFYTAPTRVGDLTPGGNNIIVIISKAVYDSMPGTTSWVSTVMPPKVRVGASDLANMPFFKNVSQANAEQWAFNAGTSGFRFIGIRFGVDPTVAQLSRIMRFGNGDVSIQTNVSLCPQNLGVDRCAWDGHATLELKAGIEFQAESQYAIDCYTGDNIHHSGQDCQAIRWFNSPGPTAIVNCRLVASTENVLVGGAFSACGLPSDLEFRWNELTKPLTWNVNHPSYAGVQWDIKNLFELKACGYALIEGNYIHRSWPANQAGAALLLKAESYGNGATIGYTHDVLVRWNVIEDAGYGCDIAGLDNVDPAHPPTNVWLTGNVFAVGGTYFDASTNPFFQTGLCASCGSIHDTFIAKGTVNAINQPTANTGFCLIDSIFDSTSFGIKGDNVGGGTATLNLYCPGADVRKCAFVGVNAASYPATNYAPANAAAVGFTNYAGGDYSLAGTNQTAGGPAVAVATALVITTQPGNIASGGTVSAVVQVVDQFGAPFAAAATITATRTSGTGTITSGSTAATNSAGAATFACGMAATTTESDTLTFSSPNLTSVLSSAFTITVPNTPAATTLSVTTQPSATTSGSVMSPSVVVKVLDQFGAVFNSSATITLASASGVATYTGLSAVCSAGVATFSTLTPTTATTGSNTLTVASAGLPSITTSAFTVTAPPIPVPTSLAITTQPGTTASGSAFSPQPVVTVLDQFGAVYPHGATGRTITATIASGTATLTGTTVVTSLGIGTYTALTPTIAVTGLNTITFSTPGLTSVTSSAFTVTQPPAPPPPPAPPFPTITNFAVSPTLLSGAANVTLTWATSSATTLSIDNGVGTVTGTSKVVTVSATTTFTLTATNASGATQATATVTVTIPPPPPPPPTPPPALVATSMRIKTLPTSITAGLVVSPQPEVEILDQFGNVLTTSTLTVTCVATGGTVSAGSTSAAVSGDAIFSGLVVI